jgi:hypothetical protein
MACLFGGGVRLPDDIRGSWFRGLDGVGTIAWFAMHRQGDPDFAMLTRLLLPPVADGVVSDIELDGVWEYMYNRGRW